MSAVEQIVTAPVTRDIAWLRQALQSAIALEHSTLPLYTAAMLSLEVQNYPTYNTIRSVLMEEMVHMATAANMLAAIGGTPDIKRLDPRFPRQGLPGGRRGVLHPLGQINVFLIAQVLEWQYRNAFLRWRKGGCGFAEKEEWNCDRRTKRDRCGSKGCE